MPSRCVGNFWCVEHHHKQENYTTRRGGRCENLEAYLSEKANKILIYSPDTDVYNIGLCKHIISHVECIVQINLPHPSEQRFVSLNNLKTALDNDPDLASINREGLLNTLQMLFIVSGCDYTSYFAGIGNTASLNILTSSLVTHEKGPFVTTAVKEK